jgi:hypothetical protein
VLLNTVRQLGRSHRLASRPASGGFAVPQPGGVAVDLVPEGKAERLQRARLAHDVRRLAGFADAAAASAERLSADVPKA